MDSFWVGLAYGLKGIRTPWFSLAVISGTSAGMVLISMLAGNLVGGWLPLGTARDLGAGILFAVGLWFLIQAWAERETKDPGRPLLQVRISMWGIIIQILRDPAKADLDASGAISLRESLALGLALAIDSVGAGFGAAMAGLSVDMVPPLVGLFAAILLLAGARVGLLFGKTRWGERGASLRGLVLLALALWELR